MFFILLLLSTLASSITIPAPCHSTCKNSQGIIQSYCTSPQNLNACTDCSTDVLQLSTSSCVGLYYSGTNYVSTQIIHIIDSTAASALSDPASNLTSMSIPGTWTSALPN